jgi:hypothetical protein
MESKTQRHKVISSYVYKDTIKRVFDCYRLPEIFNRVMYKADLIKLKNGTHYAEKGAILKLGWKNLFQVTFEIIDVVDTETYKKITFYTKKVKPYNLKYTLNFIFLWNSIESTTVFVHEMIFDDPEAKKVLDNSHDLKEKKEMFKGIEKILKERVEDLIQIETILIKRNMNYVWDSVTYYDKLKRMVPAMAEHISIEGFKGQVGTIVHINDPIKGIEYDLKVIKRDQSNPDSWQISFECLNSRPKCPLQVIDWTFVKISANNTFVEFKHCFKENIPADYLQRLSKHKMQVLSDLKMAMECEESQ